MQAPPLFVNFNSKESFLNALSEETRNQYRKDIEDCCQKKLPPIVSFRVLSVLFGCSTGFIKHLYYHAEKYYRTFTIPKGKGKRTISAPRISLKIIQKWFSYHLSYNLKFSENVFGFIPGRSAIDAANVHCGAKWVYNLDVEDYFPSISIQMVKNKLIDIGYTEYSSELISKLVCRKSFLVQGSPASPVLSNLVFMDLDDIFTELAEKYNLKYTRYADDIVFSSRSFYANIYSDLQDQVHQYLNSYGFKVSNKKEHLSILPHRLKVHGLLVHNKYPRLTKQYRNKIRAYRHLHANNKVSNADKSKILGHIAYAKGVESYFSS